MAEFLTPAWVAELDAVSRTSSGALRTGSPVTVELRVLGAPGGDFVFQVAFGDGTLRFASGSPSEPDLLVLVDSLFAARIHSGDANAQEALAAGALKIRGDLRILAGTADALSVLGDLFAALRPSTPAPTPRGAGSIGSP